MKVKAEDLASERNLGALPRVNNILLPTYVSPEVTDMSPVTL